MRKLTLTLILGAITLMPAITKAQAFEEGKSQISLGYGLVNSTQAFVFAYGELENSSLGPIFLKYEYGVSEKVGFGLNVAYATASASYDNIFLDELTSLDWWGASFNARVNRHFGSSDKFDPYIGFGMGYKIANWSYSNDDDNDIKALIPLGFEATFGARYMFTPNIGLFSEVGLAKGIIQAGLNIKI